MNANTEIVIGSKGAEHVSLEISNRSYEDWHSASIGIRCDGWQGNVRRNFRKGELLVSLKRFVSSITTFLERHD
jgi:hypothetical protein